MMCASEQCLDTLNVLIAEDYPDSRDFLQMLLEDTVKSVDVAVNGRQALEQLTVGDYDLVLMDCCMPEMSGYEATRILRQREGQQKHTAIIGLTANTARGDREKCLAAGMDEYLTKPVLINDLLEAMTEVAKASELC
ncbi:MAG: response regulator [Cyanobacteria bacterium P01_A01_bin.17]